MAKATFIPTADKEALRMMCDVARSNLCQTASEVHRLTAEFNAAKGDGGAAHRAMVNGERHLVSMALEYGRAIQDAQAKGAL